MDNYDSFTYNLVQYLAEEGAEVLVRRNDEIDVKGARRLHPDGIVISPGPGNPEDGRSLGVSGEILSGLSREVPTLGVCLGLQGMAFVFGGRVVRAPRVVHGKSSLVQHDGSGIFEGIPNPVRVGRYHSLAVDPSTLPPQIEPTAWSLEDGVLMGARHKTFPLEGVQFHPESILTDHGHEMIRNFLRRCQG